MKVDTKKIYERRIDDLKKYIQQNIGDNEKLLLINLSKIACCCKKHLHRMFKLMIGETLHEYVNRLRMEKAKKLLYENKLTIGDIADEIGYADKNSFRKAFKNYYALPPKHFLKKMINEPDYKFLKTKHMKLKQNIVDLKPLSVIYIRVKGNYDFHRPEVAWKKLWDFVDNNQVPFENAQFFGIIHDDTEVTEPENCRYDACISIDTDIKIKQGVGVAKLKGGRYAVFTHKGSYESIDNTYKSIFEEWESVRGHEFADEPILEKYLNDPEDVKPDELLTEIYIPIC